MLGSRERGGRILALMDAFAKDGFEVVRIVRKFGKIGIAAESGTAVNYDTGRRKKAFYLEGSGYETGFLLGLLAEPDISAMSVEFTNKVVFSFIGSKLLEKLEFIQEVFVSLIYNMSKKAYEALPPEFRDEIRGLYEGCLDVNPETKVKLENLIVLNLGFDVLCSMVYTGELPIRGLKEITPEDLKIPLMCNAFSVSGPSAGHGHFFGRDFMFPTAGVFQDTAAMIIYNPDPPPGRRAVPFVSVTAPGMVGSISAMNMYGTAAGVNMSPAGNCEPGKIGVNSLLLVRRCIQESESAEAAVRLICETPRGVSWLYVIADGGTGRACVVEAGSSGASPGVMQFPPADIRPLLPDPDLAGHGAPDFKNGMMVRWNDYQYPSEFLRYNAGLWAYHNSKNSGKKMIYPDAFGEKGFINRNGADQNCPSSFYFAPQREDNADIVLVSNHCVIPRMRYFAMHPWTARVVGDTVNDIQWRYDELNSLIAETLDQKGSIDYEAARELISFLSPSGRNPFYHSGNPRSKDGKEIRIEGCISLFDLKKLTVESHYGYYCDKWVKLTLPNYF